MLIEVDILWILKCTLYAIMQFMFMSFVFKLFFCYGRTKKENILIVVLLWSSGSCTARCLLLMHFFFNKHNNVFFSFFSAGSNSIPMLKWPYYRGLVIHLWESLESWKKSWKVRKRHQNTTKSQKVA